MSTTGDSEATTTTAATETSTTNRKQPFPQGFLDTISTGWAERPETFPPARSRAAFAARRRHALVYVDLLEDLGRMGPGARGR